MKRSTDRILTTHVGSLARPTDLLDLMKAKVDGESYDEEAYARRIPSAVAEIVVDPDGTVTGRVLPATIVARGQPVLG